MRAKIIFCYYRPKQYSCSIRKFWNVDIIKIRYKSNILIEKNKTNGLNRDSIVKTDTIYKILNNQIIFKIGKVDSSKIEEYKNSFYEIYNKEN